MEDRWIVIDGKFDATVGFILRQEGFEYNQTFGRMAKQPTGELPVGWRLDLRAKLYYGWFSGTIRLIRTAR